jgi:hypothetical protein
MRSRSLVFVVGVLFGVLSFWAVRRGSTFFGARCSSAQYESLELVSRTVVGMLGGTVKTFEREKVIGDEYRCAFVVLANVSKDLSQRDLDRVPELVGVWRKDQLGLSAELITGAGVNLRIRSSGF